MIKIFQDNFRPAFSLKYAGIAIVYFALSLFGILHHEIWLDEMHHFLLARDSASISQLVFNARYDGHPLFWDLLLMGLTKFTHDPFSMQVLHIFLSLLAVLVFLRNAPFSDPFKILVVFGYFMFYEYNIISRNYAMSMLFLFTSCSLITSPQKRYPAIFLSLFLLSCTHLFSLFCALPLFAVTVMDYRRGEKKNISTRYFSLLSVVFVFLVGWILWSVIPPHDHFLRMYDTDPYLSFKRIGKAFSVYFKGFYHLPDFTVSNFWNTNYLVNRSKSLSVIPSVICFIAPAFLFAKKPLSLFFFYFSTLAIAAFIFFAPIIGGVRYCGFMFLALLAGLWLEQISPAMVPAFNTNNSVQLAPGFIARFKGPFIYSILVVQLFSSVYAYTEDTRRPFSEGQAVAAYLRASIFQKYSVAVSNQSSGPPISGYLDRKVFYPETNDTGSFCKWNTIPFVIGKDEIISRLKNVPGTILFLRNDSSFGESVQKDLPVYSDPRLQIFYITRFTGGIVRSEDFWMYEVKKVDPGRLN